MTIGAIDRRTARWQEAQANFKRAVELDPRNFVVVMEAAFTFQGMRRYIEARRLFQQALTILPNNPFALYLLGFNYFADTGDAAEWRKQLEVVAQQGPEAARSVAFPAINVTRLEYEPISIGVKSVSAAITRTRLSEQPSTSAAICAVIVSEPWPISEAPV